MDTMVRPPSFRFTSLTPPNLVRIVSRQVRMVPATLPSGAAGRGPLWVLGGAIVLTILGMATLSDWQRPDSAHTQSLQQTVVYALDTNTPGFQGRLVRAVMTSKSDATVEFVLRDTGDTQTSRAAALSDTLAIARALYQVPQPGLIDVTLLGLAARPSPDTSYLPILYASLPADELVGRDWAALGPDELPRLVALRWLPTGLCQGWNECGVPIA